MRPSGRTPEAMRPVSLEPGVAKYAEGSCLARFGDTHVLCTASVEERVPPFLRNTGRGWVTAEYGMLPRSTHTRADREAARGRQSGRTQEIQRLIGRSLRAITDLGGLGERQIRIDCDVIQADGGTRTAAITGSYVALYQALAKLSTAGLLPKLPLTDSVAAISCGVFDGVAVPICTAAITGSYVALYQALAKLSTAGLLPKLPLTDSVAAISCGVFDGVAV